jgi:hypothetical protein
LITGSGFLPNRSVTIRITYICEDIVNYLGPVEFVQGGDGFCAAYWWRSLAAMVR